MGEPVSLFILLSRRDYNRFLESKMEIFGARPSGVREK
jgi:hypothetical protein